MKIQIILSITLFAITIFSCNERSAVLFTESQPRGAIELSDIPEELQGSYINISDSSKLFVYSNLIYKTSYYPISTHINDLDRGFIFKDNAIYDEVKRESIEAILIGDSIK